MNDKETFASMISTIFLKLIAIIDKYYIKRDK